MSIALTEYQLNASVLFTLHTAHAPLPKTTLTDILTLCGMNGFELSESIQKLIEDGHILQYQMEDQEVFLKLSENGRQLADIAKSSISIALRQKLVSVTATELAKLRANLAVQTQIDPVDDLTDSGFWVTAMLQDDGLKLFQIKLYAPTKLQAEMMCQTYKKDPLTIYKNVLSLFLGLEKS